MHRILVAAGAVAVLAFPAAAQDSPKALQDAFVAAVEAEDAEALAALYAEDAISYAPDGSVARGRAEIAASWAPFFDNYDDFAVSLEPHGDLDASKKTHASWGLWTMSMTPVGDAVGGARETLHGRFSDISIKTKDGWRYIVDHASPLRSAPDTASTD